MTIGVGIALFVAPSTGRILWPWPLTPLTARAISAWLLGLGVVIATAAYENDWVRIRPATGAYAALGFFQSVALARYGSEIAWGHPSAWVYVGFLVSMIFVGLYGWAVASRFAKSHRVPTVEVGPVG